MVRGDTTTFRISLPIHKAATSTTAEVAGIEIDTLERYCLAFGQRGRKVFDVESNFNAEQIATLTTYGWFEVRLASEDTLKLRAGGFEVQLKLFLYDNEVRTSRVGEFEILDTICEGNDGTGCDHRRESCHL